MTVDNSKTIISRRIKIFTATVLVIAYFILTYFAQKLKYPILGMSETVWTIMVVSVYFIYALYPMILNYQYVYYSDEGDVLSFRYFLAGIAGGRKNSVQIKKNNFAGYKIETRYFGLVESIILYQQFREGIAGYPPIYISNLSKEEKAKVLRSLNLHTPDYVKEVTPKHE
jgi:hypothetical protein